MLAIFLTLAVMPEALAEQLVSDARERAMLGLLDRVWEEPDADEAESLTRSAGVY